MSKSFKAGSAHIELSARGKKLRADFERHKKHSAKVSDKMGKMFGVNLAGGLKSKSRLFKKQMDALTKYSARGFKKALKGATILAGAGGIVGGAFTLMAKKSLQAADDLQHFSKQVGVSAELLQEYTYIANRLGLSQSDMNNAFVFGTKNLGEFMLTGAGPAAEAIKTLGLEQDIASGKIQDSGQFMDALIIKLSDVTNTAKRGALAGKVFGQRYGPVLNELMNQGSKGIINMKKEARDLGAVLSNDLVKTASDANDTLGKLGDVLRTSVTRQIAEMAPEIEQATNALIDLAPSLFRWAGAVSHYIETASNAWNASFLGKGIASDIPRSLSGIDKMIAKLNDFEKRQKRIQKNPVREAFTLDNYGIAKDQGVSLFGKDTYKQIKKDQAYLTQVVAERRSLLTELRDGLVQGPSDPTGKLGLNSRLKQLRQFGKELGAEYGIAGVGLHDANNQFNEIVDSMGSDLFGEKRREEIKTSGDNYVHVIAEEGARINKLIEALPANKPPTGKTTKNLLSDADVLGEGFMEHMKEVQRDMQLAKDFALAAKTPIEEYEARLKQLAAIESNSVLRNKAGGKETFSRLRVLALKDLADATVDLENDTASLNPILAELNKLTKSGDIDAENAKEAYADLTAEINALNSEFNDYLSTRELERAIHLAALANSEELVQQLDRELAIRQKIADLQEYGGITDLGQATDIATQEVNEEDIAAARGRFRQAFGDALHEAVIEGDWRGALNGVLEGAADRMFDKAVDQLADSVFDILADVAPKLLGDITGSTTLAVSIQGAHTAGSLTVGAAITTSGGIAATEIGVAMVAAGTTVAAQIAAAMALGSVGGDGGAGGIISEGIGALLSFDGGGFTGSGSRSGGIDGKGGFAAILHPNESVVDHTKNAPRLTPLQDGIPDFSAAFPPPKGGSSRTVNYAPVSHFHGYTQADLQQSLDQRDMQMKREIPGLIDGRIHERNEGYA